jgi:hypothetical protein
LVGRESAVVSKRPGVQDLHFVRGAHFLPFHARQCRWVGQLIDSLEGELSDTGLHPVRPTGRTREREAQVGYAAIPEVHVVHVVRRSTLDEETVRAGVQDAAESQVDRLGQPEDPLSVLTQPGVSVDGNETVQLRCDLQKLPIAITQRIHALVG